MESELMLTPREKFPLPRLRGGSNPQPCITQDSELNTLLTELFQPPNSFQNDFKYIFAAANGWQISDDSQLGLPAFTTNSLNKENTTICKVRNVLNNNTDGNISQNHKQWLPPRKTAEQTGQSVCLMVACSTSQQHASASQGRICTDNFTCCHTETEVVDQTFYLTKPQYTDTGPTSLNADSIMPGAWQGSHWSANF